jgi:hypothetical protein
MRTWLAIIEDDENVLGRDVDTVEMSLQSALQTYGGFNPGLHSTIVGQGPAVVSRRDGYVHYGAKSVIGGTVVVPLPDGSTVVTTEEDADAKATRR